MSEQQISAEAGEGHGPEDRPLADMLTLPVACPHSGIYQNPSCLQEYNRAPANNHHPCTESPRLHSSRASLQGAIPSQHSPYHTQPDPCSLRAVLQLHLHPIKAHCFRQCTTAKLKSSATKGSQVHPSQPTQPSVLTCFILA